MIRVLFCLLVVTALAPGSHAGDKKTPHLDGWGKVMDRDGDCTFKADRAKLTVLVPATLHDLHPRNGRLNAPRVLQEVRGDFTVQVRVTSDFEPGKKTTAPKSLPFIGAGILIWSDEKNYLRLERNLWWRQDVGKHICYTPLVEYFKEGEAQNNSPGTSAEPFFKGRSTFLKLTRRGNKIAAALSHDGKDWMATKEIVVDFPQEVSVGLLAINTSDRAFRVEFDEFSLMQQ